MNVTLTPEDAQFVAEKMKSGRYSNENEVIREGLLRLREQDDLSSKEEELRGEIMIGIEDLRQGRKSVFNQGTIERIIAAGQARRAAGGNGHE